MFSKEIIGGVTFNITKKANLKNLYIRVLPPIGEVIVRAPISISNDEIRLFALSKLPEIVRIRNKMHSQVRQTKREYVSGESHYLWGKPYMLKVKYANKSNVEKIANKLILTVPEGATIEKREEVLNKWYRAELTRVMKQLIEKCEKITHVSASEYKIKSMKTKWGTCNIQDRRIWLNLQLIKKPISCLEYIMIHELVHLLEKNHTNRFYSLIGEFYPNWKQVVNLLDEMPLDFIE